MEVERAAYEAAKQEHDISNERYRKAERAYWDAEAEWNRTWERLQRAYVAMANLEPPIINR